MRKSHLVRQWGIDSFLHLILVCVCILNFQRHCKIRRVHNSLVAARIPETVNLATTRNIDKRRIKRSPLSFLSCSFELFC